MCHRVAPVLFKELQLALDLYAQTGHARIPRDNPVPKDVYPGAKLATIVLARPGEGIPSPSRQSTSSQSRSPLPLQAQELVWGFSRQDDGQPNERQLTRAGRSAGSSRPTGPSDPSGLNRPTGPNRSFGSSRPAGVSRSTGPKRRLVFNTRLDTALYQLRNGRGMWAQPIAEGRCLVPVRAFYESWTRPGSPDPTGKSAVRFSMSGHGIFLLAAVANENEVSIVTTEPNSDVSRVHSRMPLVLGPGESSIWLGPDFAQLADRSSIHLAAELVAPPAPTGAGSRTHSHPQAQPHLQGQPHSQAQPHLQGQPHLQAQPQNQMLFPE